ncbi:MAG TPA: hypothetical protein DCM08_02795 [Microscillaceae bacterium]|jgi:uncharacterized membrane protein|nr:hypothetical protein [Microscillaceae bacterium]
MGYIYLIINIILTVYCQVLLKWRLQQLPPAPESSWEKLWFFFWLLFDPLIFSALVATFLAGLAWMAALTKFELSYAYPFSTISFVLVFLLGYFFLQETINVYKVAGTLLIILGVILVGRGG